MKANDTAVRLMRGTAGRIVAAGLAGIVTIGSVTALLSSESDLQFLHRIEIVPSEDSVVEAGDIFRMTAIGEYVSGSVPIVAAWSVIDGGAHGTLRDCEGKKTHCTLVAGDWPGFIRIRAGRTDATGEWTFATEKSIEVLPPKPQGATEERFDDAMPSWAVPAAVSMGRIGVMNGYSDGSFGARDPMTRGQIITVITRMLLHAGLTDIPRDCSHMFDDVPSDHYAFEAACLFQKLGWADTTPTFDPDRPASRGEMATFLRRVFGTALLKAQKTDLADIVSGGRRFDDVPTDHPLFIDTSVVDVTGLMTGYANGFFGMEDSLNRAESAVIMHRVLARIGRY